MASLQISKTVFLPVEMSSHCSWLETDVVEVDKSSIVSIGGDSQSKSIMAIVTLKDSTRAFVKIWSGYNPQTFESLREKNPESVESELSLFYETEVYREVVRPLVDAQICPNFVRFILSAENCPINEFAEQKGAFGDYLMLNKKKWMSKLHFDKVDRGLPPPTKINYLVTQSVPPKTRTLVEIINNENPPQRQELYNMVFQILAGCYALSLSRTTVNDMHTKNIFVEDIPPTKMVYIYDDTVYEINTSLKPLIFDFDRAYAERLGPNPQLLDNILCKKFSQCNTAVPTKDMYKVLCSVYRFVPDAREDILYCLGSDRSLIIDMFEKDYVCYCRYNERGIPDDFFYTLNPPSEILRRWAERGNLIRERGGEDVSAENVFVCSPSMFDSEGVLVKDAGDPGIIKAEL